MICYLSVSLSISLCIRAFKVSISSSVNGMSFANWEGAAMTFFCICLPVSAGLTFLDLPEIFLNKNEKNI